VVSQRQGGYVGVFNATFQKFGLFLKWLGKRKYCPLVFGFYVVVIVWRVFWDFFSFSGGLGTKKTFLLGIFNYTFLLLVTVA